MGLAENLKRIRLQKQMSQPTLARDAGVSKGYIYMLESEEVTNPSLEILYKIANTLGCTVAELIGQSRVAATQEQPEITEGLRKFAKERKRAGEPLSEDDILNLARIQFRGKRPETVDDWTYIYQFFKRTFGGK
ncbi:MAG: helix-turn-helix transcriptional regulator [Planctomycetia bacterium]|nr:helix-turn-helix transcriptional regulator [Planctomycetia bacterium]